MGGSISHPETRARAALRRLLEVATQARDEAARRSEPADPGAYEEIFQRTLRGAGELRQRLLDEQKRAPAQWQALERHPQTRRLVRIRNDRRLQTWGFCKFLVERARMQAGNDPSAAVEAAELAVAVARCLEPAEHGEERIADFLASALAALAEARRQRRDLAGAWEAFAGACEHLQDGTGDPLEKAELGLLHERLLRDCGREKEADRAHERARNLFRRIGDMRLEGAAEHQPMKSRASR
jgi:hypothetical protein